MGGGWATNISLISSLSACPEVHSCNRKDGWMTFNFMSFLTVFQSCQGDGWMILKGCV